MEHVDPTMRTTWNVVGQRIGVQAQSFIDGETEE